jgi:hypothetical protein
MCLYWIVLTRRDFIKASGQTCAVAGFAPLLSVISTPAVAAQNDSLRCINIINFIREIEPRFEMDMMLPVQRPMELILEHQFEDVLHRDTE